MDSKMIFDISYSVFAVIHQCVIIAFYDEKIEKQFALNIKIT